MVEVIGWPASLLRISAMRLFLRNTTRTSGVALNGIDQVISNGAQVWELSMTLTTYGDPTLIKEFEAIVTEMRGRENIASLPIFDAYAYNSDVSPLQSSWDDGQWFDDGTGLVDDNPSVQPLLTTAAVAAGDRELYTDLTGPTRPGLRLGDVFSFYGHLYRVVRRNGAGWVKFEPAARRPIASGVTLNTATPIFYARFATDGEGARGRDVMSFGEPITINFVEAFDRP